MTIYVICLRLDPTMAQRGVILANPNEYFSTYEDAVKRLSETLVIGQAYIRPLTKG